MLHTLYQQNVKARTNFFVEWMALDLIRDAEGDVVGVAALEMETGELHIFEAKTTLLATGGAGRIFAASTNAFINTGDGLGMAARAGVPLEDMEFWQFHPPACTTPVCCSPKAAAARVRSCATSTASASWSATRRR